MHLKKLVLASLLSVTAAGFSTKAYAGSAADTVYDAVSNGGYIQVGAGLGSPSGSEPGAPSLDSGMNVNLALGWEWDVAPDLRVELEYSRFAPGDKGLVTGVNLQAFMVNVAVDVPINGRFPQWEIYIGGGLGFTMMSADNSPSEDGTGYQFFCGLSVELQKHWSFFGGYRYRAYQGSATSDMTADIVEAGVRYGF